MSIVPVQLAMQLMCSSLQVMAPILASLTSTCEPVDLMRHGQRTRGHRSGLLGLRWPDFVGIYGEGWLVMYY